MDKQTQKQLLNIVKKNYSEIAEQYSETRKKHLSPLWDELVKIVAEIKDGDKILDVGCGNGRLLDFLKDKKIEYLGVDASENLIKCARELHPKNEFVVNDILELSSLPKLNFDFVFSIALLHHLPSLELRVAALRQLKNKINNSGEIVITVWNMWNQPRFRKLIGKFLLLKMLRKNKFDFGDILFDWKDNCSGRTSQRYYHAFTMRELKKIFRLAGLKVVKVFKDKYNYYLVLKK